jgi:hypothetical protein
MAGLLDLLPKDSVFRQEPKALNEKGQRLLDLGVAQPLAKFFSEHYDISDVDGIAAHLKRLNGSKAADYPQLYFSSKGGLLDTSVPTSAAKLWNKGRVLGLTVPPGPDEGFGPPGVHLMPFNDLPTQAAAQNVLPHELLHWSKPQGPSTLPYENALSDEHKLMRQTKTFDKESRHDPVARYLIRGVVDKEELLADLAGINASQRPGQSLLDDPIAGPIVRNNMPQFLQEAYGRLPQMSAYEGEIVRKRSWLGRLMGY